MNAFRVKSMISRLARRLGYRIERIVEEDAHPLDLFEVLIDRLRQERGEAFFFVQVGAHDGKSDDPIRKYVEAFRWRGILVEPQSAVFKRLKENYRDQPQLQLVNAAIGVADGEQNLYLPAEDEGMTVLATFDERVLRKRIGAGAKVRTLAVKTMTAATLLRDFGITSVDFLQIDTEGFDFEIIKMFDAAGVRPSLIRFEHYNFDEATRKACLVFLEGQGYRMSRQGIDIIAFCPPVGVAG